MSFVEKMPLEFGRKDDRAGNVLSRGFVLNIPGYPGNAKGVVQDLYKRRGCCDPGNESGEPRREAL
jgi:hypothetical protein